MDATNYYNATDSSAKQVSITTDGELIKIDTEDATEWNKWHSDLVDNFGLKYDKEKDGWC